MVSQFVIGFPSSRIGGRNCPCSSVSGYLGFGRWYVLLLNSFWGFPWTLVLSLFVVSLPCITAICPAIVMVVPDEGRLELGDVECGSFGHLVCFFSLCLYDDKFIFIYDSIERSHFCKKCPSSWLT